MRLAGPFRKVIPMTRELKKALIRTMIAITAILVLGSAGYLIIEDGWTVLEAFYMTLITITTIGYGEIRSLSNPGRIFTSFLIVGGIGTAATALTQIGSLVIESRIGSLLGRKKMDERIRHISGHYIICGFGDIGAAIAMELDRVKIPFIVVDSNGDTFARVESLGFPAVNGDATTDSVLIAAGIRRAAGLVVCVGDLTTNLVTVMAGRELNPSLHIVARGADTALEERLIRAGADSVTYPLKLGGQSIARLIMEQTGGSDEMAMGGDEPGILGYRVRLYRNFSLESSGGSETIADIIAKTGALEAVHLKRADGSEILRPDQNTIIAKGDALALLIRETKGGGAKEADVPVWSEDMSVGISSIDEEHRMLLRLIVRIGEAAEKKSPRSEIAEIFDRLIEYTEKHFTHEEQIFRKFQYPDTEVHVLEHKQLVAQVLELNHDRNAVLPANITDFLLDWLKLHIMGMDHKYVDFFRGKNIT
jgi:hemerythrin-like metal-binding protein